MGNTAEDKLKRIEWVADNWAELQLDGYPYGEPPCGPRRGLKDRQIVMAMQRLGMLSFKTNWRDVQVNNLVQDARIELRLRRLHATRGDRRLQENEQSHIGSRARKTIQRRFRRKRVRHDAKESRQQDLLVRKG
jgi:hypothetical protein